MGKGGAILLLVVLGPTGHLGSQDCNRSHLVLDSLEGYRTGSIICQQGVSENMSLNSNDHSGLGNKITLVNEVSQPRLESPGLKCASKNSMDVTSS